MRARFSLNSQPSTLNRFGALLLCAVLLLARASARGDEAGTVRAEALLSAMGGRAAWAKVKFVHVEAVHDDVSVRDPFTNKIWNDFSAPRLRFEARNPQIDRLRVIDGGTGWRRRDGVESVLTPEQVEDDRLWWEANIYRTLHRLAINDPELSVRAVGENRVEIFRKDGKRLNWFVLNQRGEPMLFGTWQSEAGTAFGPLATSGEIKYPKWGAVPSSPWRYEIVRLVTAESPPPDVSFSKP